MPIITATTAVIVASIIGAVWSVLASLHSTVSTKAKIDRAKEQYEKAKSHKATTADLQKFLNDAYSIAEVNGTHAVEKITKTINKTYSSYGYSSGAVESVLARVRTSQQKLLDQAELERKLGESSKAQSENLKSQYSMLSDEEKSKAKDAEGNWISGTYGGDIGIEAENKAKDAATHFGNASNYEAKV